MSPSAEEKPRPASARRAVRTLALLGALALAACGQQPDGAAQGPAQGPVQGKAQSKVQASAPAGAQASAAPPTAVVPVTVQVCGQSVTYDKVPQRAVTHDVNLTEMFLFLGLGDRLVGYSGLRDSKRVAPQFQAALAQAPNLSPRGMNLERIVAAEADFVFGGWSYGFRDGGVTPQLLAELGIASYVLTESCIRKVARERVSLEDTFADMLNLGRIFRIEAQAQALVQAQREELAATVAAVQGVAQRPLVFVYDSGQDVPQTAGRYGMPHAMIEAAGGRNLFADIPANWPKANWEDVVQRNPDWIVVIDYDQPDAQGKIDFLLAKPELQHVTAIRHKRFIVLDYAEATPGPRNVARVRTLAQALHPQRFGP